MYPLSTRLILLKISSFSTSFPKGYSLFRSALIADSLNFLSMGGSSVIEMISGLTLLIEPKAVLILTSLNFAISKFFGSSLNRDSGPPSMFSSEVIA